MSGLSISFPFQLKGQQKIPEFFKLTKSASTSLSAGKGKPKEPTSLEPREFKIEQITRLLRGDQVKILFLPKLHYELDASQYVSIFLLYEIKRLQEDEEIIDIKRQCVTAVDHLNSEVWKFAIDHVERCERFYRDNDYSDICLSAENLEEEVEAENGVVVKEEDEPKEPIEVTTAAQSDRNADENNEISAPSAQGGDT